MRPSAEAFVPIRRPVEDAAVASFIGSDGRSARALVLEGAAGIGKSLLWGAGIAAALAQRDTVLSARAVQTEASMSFAALGDLFEKTVDATVVLPLPQRAALEVALLRRTPGSMPPTEREIGVAVLAALRLLAARTPLLLAIDDVQWLDSATAEVLGYALRRLRDEPIRVLLSRRTVDTGDQPDHPAGASPVMQAVRDLDLEIVGVGPLPDPDVVQLIRARLGPGASAKAVRRLAEAACGNPYWALELAAMAGPHESAGEIAVPPSLNALLTARLGRLPNDARVALAVVAALSRPTYGAVARAMGVLVADPDDALDAALAAGILTETAGRLRPAHPLLGAAGLQAHAPSWRRQLHTQLAGLSTEPEERARHLALGTTGDPDAVVAEALDLGVRSARSRGASHAAADLAERAVLLTPTSDHSALARRRLDAAELFFAAGDLDRSCALAAAAYASDPSADIMPRLLPLLIEVTYWVRGQAAAQAILAAVLQTPGIDARRRAVALTCAADVGDGSGRPRAELAQEAIDLFASLGDTDPGVLSTALVYLAEDHIDSGKGIALDVLSRAEAAERRQQLAQPRWIPIFNRVASIRAYQLKIVEDLPGARTELLKLLTQARHEGDETSLPALLGHLALTECWAGNYVTGLDVARDGLAQAAQGGGVVPAVLNAAYGLLAVLTGDAATARALIGQQLLVGSTAIASKRTLVYRHILGLADLLDGDPAAALAQLDAAWSISAELGIAEPGRRQRLEADLGEALVACGQLDRAAELGAAQRTIGERFDRPTLTGIGFRLQGLVLAARGQLDAAVTALDAAMTAHQRSPLPLELARTQLALGQVHRRRRTTSLARSNLEAAQHQFRALGAKPWIAITQAQVVRLGRQRAAGELTSTETRVAVLASTGHNNREIAAELFIGVRTVEGHLAAVYRKLNVRGRADLAHHAGLPA